MRLALAVSAREGNMNKKKKKKRVTVRSQNFHCRERKITPTCQHHGRQENLQTSREQGDGTGPASVRL